MSVNVPETQLLYDDGQNFVLKVVGYFNAATSSNNLILQANTLAWANSSKPCVLSIKEVQYNMDLATGYVQLQWVGNTSNVVVLSLGGRGGAEAFVTYMPNPLAANSANLNHGLGGDIGLQIVSAASLDTFSIIIKGIKEGGTSGGYANAYIAYNDSNYQP